MTRGSALTRSSRRDKTKREPLLVVVLRTTVLTFALWAFAWDITTGVGQTAIIVGSIAGGLAARKLALSHWALWRAWLAILFVGGLGALAAAMFTSSVATGIFNPATQLDFAEFFRWGAGAFVLVAGLRTQSARYPALVAVELGFAAIAMASSLAMHRDGAVNRPTQLGDFAWAHGADPARYVIYAGCVASGAALLMLFRERSLFRTAFHLLVIALLFAGVMSLAEDVDLPAPVVSQRDVESNPWDDPDIDPNWGPTLDPDRDGLTRGDNGEGKGHGAGKADEGHPSGGRDEGEDGSGGEFEADPWSDMDDEYMSESRGEGRGHPSRGNGDGSGQSRRPFEDDFKPDAKDTDTPPGGANVIQVYTPELTPFERGNIFDGIREDGTFYHRQEKRKPLRVGRDARDPIAEFDGDARLRVRPGYVTPLPSVSPDMEIAEYTSEPAMKLRFSRDPAGNYWVESDTAGMIRLKFKVTAHLWYFGGVLPETMNRDDIPVAMVAPMPDDLRGEANEVIEHIGINRDMPLSESFPKLVEYFRSFEDLSIPEKPDDVSYYKHLSYARRGVCRHRAYAYVVTATAFGLPSHLVTNDVHAFAESWLPGVGWKRVDIGGREMNFNVTGPGGGQPFIPPRDNLPQPENYRKNKEAADANLKDPRRRRKLRNPPKRVSAEEYAKLHPDRCRKMRNKKGRRKLKHEWKYTPRTEAPVSVIALHGDYSPPSGASYFRERALSYYDGCTFKPTRRRDADQDLLTRYPTKEALTVREPPAPTHRAALAATIGDMVARRRPVTLEGIVSAEKARNPDPGRFYKVIKTDNLVHSTPFAELLGSDVGNPKWSRTTLRHYLRKPINPVYAQIANEMVDALPPEDQGDPLRQAAAILTALEDTGVYDETVSYDDDETEDPVAAFLVGDRHGHAIHFATAMALLLRTRGLPTRLVEGYVSPEANRRGGTAILLRGVDSHVWPEVYIDGAGWIPVDPAPQQSVSDGVVPPDPELQRMLGEMLRGQYEDKKDKAGAAPRTTAHRSLSKLARSFLKFLGALVLLALLLIMPTTVAVKIWRRLIPAMASGDGKHRLIYRACLDRLAEGGFVRDFGETREAFSERLWDQIPSLTELTRAHVGLYFGSRERPDAEDLTRMATTVRGELKRATPWWRRALGFFNPATLWQAR